jgi:hypothetical protein
MACRISIGHVRNHLASDVQAGILLSMRLQAVTEKSDYISLWKRNVLFEINRVSCARCRLNRIVPRV